MGSGSGSGGDHGELEKALWEGRSSVIDTQNFTVESKKPYYHDIVQSSSTISSLLKSYKTGSGPMNCRI